MESKRCLITGITGQDGSYLAELLISKGYNVFGLVRRLSVPNLKNIEGLVRDDSIHLIDGDLLDQASIIKALKISEPDEVYNLAAQSFVATSWQQAMFTCEVTGLGALRMFDACRMIEDYTGKKVKIYQASSSEMYGNVPAPQNEESVMKPRSPYGIAKLMAHEIARVYRESYGMWISCGICFNHTSERRGIEFVSQKIANSVARIKLGLDKELKLGNVRSKRDWGYSPEYAEAMWMMLNNTDKPDDFVIASGKNHSVREFCQIAFDYAELGNWEQFVKFDKSLERPAEIYELIGDYSKAKRVLGWEPKTGFRELVKIMVHAQLKLFNEMDG